MPLFHTFPNEQALITSCAPGGSQVSVTGRLLEDYSLFIGPRPRRWVGWQEEGQRALEGDHCRGESAKPGVGGDSGNKDALLRVVG